MNLPSNTKDRIFRKETQPSMHRRCLGHDYRSISYYMITIGKKSSFQAGFLSNIRCSRRIARFRQSQSPLLFHHPRHQKDSPIRQSRHCRLFRVRLLKPGCSRSQKFLKPGYPSPPQNNPRHRANRHRSPYSHGIPRFLQDPPNAAVEEDRSDARSHPFYYPCARIST